jgi:hypothetical protein
MRAAVTDRRRRNIRPPKGIYGSRYTPFAPVTLSEARTYRLEVLLDKRPPLHLRAAQKRQTAGTFRSTASEKRYKRSSKNEGP